ncbi:MAG TPA: mechanosensitive ion channel domain-containing protein [Candidatus Limnocylindrales bacterium]|jgi:small conductance mechanosensitive channel|nr:mechanosensitive ion channel domain-containing protein [Candidatus Limnocylindrales bacterium]
MEEIKSTVFKFLTEYGFQIIGALIIMTAGALVARWLGRASDQWFEKKQIEPPIRMLAGRVIRLLVFGMAVVLALEKCGVPIAPMVAGIGVAGVGIGLAMQHVLANLIAGLNIIFTKPFRVGEYVELVGESGQVSTVQLFTTTLLHTDRSRVIIPNRKIVGEILHNYGTIRQLDLSVGVAYGTNIEQALTVARKIVASNPRALKDPAPVIGVSCLGDSCVTIAVKPWVGIDNFIAAGPEINQALLETFRAQHIEIPFPQREIRLLNGPGASSATVSVHAEPSRL